MQRTFNNKITLFFLGAATLFILFAIIGGIRRYSPLPFWDMWDGYLASYFKLSDGNWRTLWAQHNEHRILLARVIFWLDVTLFHGAAWLLIAVNYVLVSFTCLVFWFFLKEQITESSHRYPARIVFLFLVAWIFAWSQRENLTWGFQNQFFTAQLLPLCAFYFLYKTSADKKWLTPRFITACFFGVLSVGTMANGVLALPLMMLYSLITRDRFQKIIVLLILSSLMLFLYCYDFEKPSNHSSFIQSILVHPKAIIQYTLLYLGSPFEEIVSPLHFVRKIMSVHQMISIAGLCFIASSLYYTVKYLQIPRKNTLELALLFFILYIGGTALGTAGGRLIFGVDSALAGRYKTPALMAWAALCLLYFPYISSCYKRYGNKAWIPFAIILTLMLPDEWSALKSKDSRLFEKKIAGLAIALNVRDAERINTLYPSADHVLAIASQAAKRNFVIAGMENLKNTRENMGKVDTSNTAMTRCLGKMETAVTLAQDNQFLRIRGFLFDAKTNSSPQLIRFLDEHHRIVGYALTGEPRPDLVKKMNRPILHAGFEGYVIRGSQWKKLTAVGDEPHCEFSAV